MGNNIYPVNNRLKTITAYVSQNNTLIPKYLRQAKSYLLLLSVLGRICSGYFVVLFANDYWAGFSVQLTFFKKKKKLIAEGTGY
jgi:hypothetical protein